ncbi:hypothetical protein GYMLUDRAFT_245916 [Collybiopsis luxurians FD-317 M1]|uniref:Uncharacterized protein n=1 Tax=Collybiopsis luxurians FD-317 M1 TaxID=944289 RepID=A0A0D0CSZ6_9AGAR|nr:hypothetical protein GYMLUDRAFT_245916 [Collybiopsis luxurians FD-317 M1]
MPPSSISGLRIAWCKARATAHCWQEEGVLVQEEMHQTLEFVDYEAVKWDHLAESGKVVSGGNDWEEFAQGRKHYETVWTDIQVELKTGVGAIALEDDVWLSHGSPPLDISIISTKLDVFVLELMVQESGWLQKDAAEINF